MVALVVIPLSKALHKAMLQVEVVPRVGTLVVMVRTLNLGAGVEVHLELQHNIMVAVRYLVVVVVDTVVPMPVVQQVEMEVGGAHMLLEVVGEEELPDHLQPLVLMVLPEITVPEMVEVVGVVPLGPMLVR